MRYASGQQEEDSKVKMSGSEITHTPYFFIKWVTRKFQEKLF